MHERPKERRTPPPPGDAVAPQPDRAVPSPRSAVSAGHSFARIHVVPPNGEVIQRTRWVAIDDQFEDVDNPDNIYSGSDAPILSEGDTWDDQTNEVTRANERMRSIFSGTSHRAPPMNFQNSSVVETQVRNLGQRAPQIPPEAQTVIEKFGQTGLLVKTLQMQHAHKDFQDAEVTLEEAAKAQQLGRYGAKRNWSLAHAQIKPNYFKMGAPVKPRNIASITDPDQFGYHRFIDISETDSSSNSKLQPDTQTLAPDEARRQMDLARTNLIEKQKASEKPIDNSEIQTLGFSANAVVGFMFKEGGELGSWFDAKPEFQKVIDRITDRKSPLPGYTPSSRSKFYIFTYTETQHGTQLIYLDTLSPK